MWCDVMWCDGMLVWWDDDSMMVLWYYGMMIVLWYAGMVGWLWYDGVLILWDDGRWYDGRLVWWDDDGMLVWWYNLPKSCCHMTPGKKLVFDEAQALRFSFSDKLFFVFVSNNWAKRNLGTSDITLFWQALWQFWIRLHIYQTKTKTNRATIPLYLKQPFTLLFSKILRKTQFAMQILLQILLI